MIACRTFLLPSLLAAFIVVQCVQGKGVKKPSRPEHQLIVHKDVSVRYQDSLTILVHKLRQTHDKAARHKIVDEMKKVYVELYGPPPDKGLLVHRKKGNPIDKSRLRKVLDALSPESGPSIVHHVPFASTKNHIVLTVDTSQTSLLAGAKAAPVAMPAWTRITTNAQIAQNVNASNRETGFNFDFSVDKTAPVNKETDLKFAITSPAGDSWMKNIKIVVDPPDRFELYQNFPNPFNPTTTISYLLPKQSLVTLKVYNMLGQEVATLVNELQEAGYRTATLDGRNLASGVYVYRIQAQNFSDLKKMILLK